MRRALALCATIALVACDSSTTPKLSLPPTDANVAGSFALTSANGVVPPFQTASNATEVTSLLNDRIILKNDLTWLDSTTYRIQRVADGVVRDTVTGSAGTYVIADQHINFTSTSAGVSFSGSVVGSTLTVIFQNAFFSYTRQSP